MFVIVQIFSNAILTWGDILYISVGSLIRYWYVRLSLQVEVQVVQIDNVMHPIVKNCFLEKSEILEVYESEYHSAPGTIQYSHN